MLHNLRTDTKVLEFRNASGVGMASDVTLVNDSSASSAATAGGACTAISFRTGLPANADTKWILNTAIFISGIGCECLLLMFTSCASGAGVGVPLLAAGGGAGVITVWNLEQRRLQVI